MGVSREVDVIDANPRVWLLAGYVPAAQRVAFEHAMSAPWCWPQDAALAEAARALGVQPPGAPAPGEVLLVTIAALEDRTALWRLSWHNRAVAEAPFRADAHVSLLRAAASAQRVAPHIHTLRPLDRPPHSATQLFKRGRGADHVLDDRSFGLPFLLAAVSVLTDRPVPAHIAATAALREDGTFVSVAGLQTKLELLAEAALAVDTVLVAEEQREEAERVARGLVRPLSVLAVADAEQAVERVFAGARDAAPSAWHDDARARTVTEELFSLCRDGAAVSHWRAVERTASWLALRFAASTRWGTRARFAALVAARHANGDAVAMRWEDFVKPGGDYTRVIAAHVLQAAADAGVDELPTYLDRARALLPDDPDEPSALELLGAIGRALAALRRYDEAAVALARAARAWLDSTTPREASYPLSEWLRVAGLLGDDATWDDAHATTEVYLNRVDRDDYGQYFVRAARARGYLLRGDADAALAALEGPVWTSAPAWLVRSTRRVRAQALDGVGRRDAAEALRSELAGDAGDRAEVEAAFSALDRALARGDDPGAEAAAVLATRPQGLRWIVEGTAAGERARCLAREYPY